MMRTLVQDITLTEAAPGARVVRRASGLSRLTTIADDVTIAGPSMHVVEGTVDTAIAEHGWIELSELTEASAQTATDRWHIRNSRIFRYRFLAPVERLEGLRLFFAAGGDGRLPESWTSTDLTSDGSTHTHALVHVDATRRTARRLGSQQRAIASWTRLPNDVQMIQHVTEDLPSFSGWTSTSSLPAPRSEATYAPGEVYQQIMPSLPDRRGDVVTDEEILLANSVSILS